MKKIIILVLFTLLSTSCYIFAFEKINAPLTIHKVFHETTSTADSVQFSPDGKYFLVGGNYYSSIAVWQTKDFSLYKNINILNDDNLLSAKERPHRIVGTCFTPDSKYVYAGLDNGIVLVIDLDSKKKTTYNFGENARYEIKTAFSSSGKILALGANYLNTANNKLIHIRTAADSGLVFTQDEKFLVSSSYRLRSVHITDISTGGSISWKPSSFFGNQNVSSSDVSPDNDIIAAGLRNGDVRLYSIRQTREIGNLSQGGINAKGNFSPDGKLLLSYSDTNKVKLWDVAKQSRERTWMADDRVSSIKWLRGTSWIAIGTNSGDLIIGSTDKEETIFKGKIMERGITDIDFLPAENLLLICDSWGNIAAFKIPQPVGLKAGNKRETNRGWFAGSINLAAKTCEKAAKYISRSPL
jgi:WD40 repeat protein